MNIIKLIIKKVSELNARRALRIKNKKQTAAYIELNNLYLAIQRGRLRLSITRSNTLRCLVTEAYDPDDKMVDWWQTELEKLPRWFQY